MATVVSWSGTYNKRTGMDGPFQYPNGRVLYFDCEEKQYYDPSTDYFVDDDEVAVLKQQLFDILAA